MWLLPLSLVLNGCGFHLRGDGLSSLANVKIAIESPTHHGEFEKNLKRDLTIAGAKPVTFGQQPEFQLKITDLQFSTQGVSRDGTGRANEHEITLRLTYQLVNLLKKDTGGDGDDQEQLNTPRSMSAKASYVQDFLNPIGERVQRKDTHTLLLQQISQRLTRRLDFLIRNS